MRVLIVGSGIGGLTLAALLRRWSIIADIVDRAPCFGHAGYLLGLSARQPRPARLQAFDDFVSASEAMNHYAVANGKGDHQPNVSTCHRTLRPDPTDQPANCCLPQPADLPCA